MTTYSTLAQAELLYGAEQIAVAFDFTDDGIADTERFELHQRSAFGLINSHIIGHHSLPLTFIPDILVKLEVDIALYNACINALKRTDEMRKRYEDAMKSLEKLASGKMKLETVENGTTLNQSQDAQIQQGRTAIYQTGARQFTGNTLKGVV